MDHLVDEPRFIYNRLHGLECIACTHGRKYLCMGISSGLFQKEAAHLFFKFCRHVLDRRLKRRALAFELPVRDGKEFVFKFDRDLHPLSVPPFCRRRQKGRGLPDEHPAARRLRFMDAFAPYKGSTTCLLPLPILPDSASHLCVPSSAWPR